MSLLLLLVFFAALGVAASRGTDTRDPDYSLGPLIARRAEPAGQDR